MRPGCRNFDIGAAIVLCEAAAKGLLWHYTIHDKEACGMEEYSIVLESQLGPRSGTLRLERRDGAVTGLMTLLGHNNPVAGRCSGPDLLSLSHHLRTAVSELACVSELKLEGGQLSGTLYCDRYRMKLHGEKISDKEDGGEGLAGN